MESPQRVHGVFMSVSHALKGTLDKFPCTVHINEYRTVQAVHLWFVVSNIVHQNCEDCMDILNNNIFSFHFINISVPAFILGMVALMFTLFSNYCGFNFLFCL